MPTAAPFTAASSGLSKAPRASRSSGKPESTSSPAARRAISSRSWPAENARPAPVSTAAWTRSSVRAPSSASAAARYSARSKALSTSGRSRVRTRTAPRSSTRITVFVVSDTPSECHLTTTGAGDLAGAVAYGCAMSNGPGDVVPAEFSRRARQRLATGGTLVVGVGDDRVTLAPDVAEVVLATLDRAGEGGHRARAAAAPTGAGDDTTRRAGAAAPEATGAGDDATRRAGAAAPEATASLEGAGRAAGGPATVEIAEELSTGQAADLLGVSRRTVVQLIERGDLRATRVGTRRRLAAAQVLACRERARSHRRSTLRDVIAASRDLDLYR
jgi:excisionase family DNA binding protein